MIPYPLPKVERFISIVSICGEGMLVFVVSGPSNGCAQFERSIVWTCQRGGDACKVFDEMSQRDTIAWCVMISYCIRNNRTRDALSLFNVMWSPSYKCEPNDVTCLLLLQACAHLNAMEFGERIHSYIMERGYGGAFNLSNSLISMYSQCGCYYCL
ncbi:Pentatricopeptide repeat-containing protein [Spatholobus suberectus]|nr:Pentatricopeptide repeat-containing protein [Spatholobus suberectus]